MGRKIILWVALLPLLGAWTSADAVSNAPAAKEEAPQANVVVAPIADNRMFALLSSFFRNQITDEEAIHSLAAIHLGEQYVMKSEKATKSLHLLSSSFVSGVERDYFKKEREKELLGKESELSAIHLAYGRQGHYWSELWTTL